MELGISYVQLGLLVNVHWVTIRRWEFGRALPQSPTKIRLLEKFINGGFDDFFKSGRCAPRPQIIDEPMPEKLLAPGAKNNASAQRKRNHILTDAQFLTELEFLNQFYLKKFFALKDGGYF